MSTAADRIRVGLIGNGRHGQAILQPALRFAPIDVVASCSLHAPSGPGQAPHYIGHKDLLAAQAQHLDACIVAVPVSEYRQVLYDVLACGLPVWSEKPAAASVEDALFLEETARQREQPLMVGFNKRFATAYAMAAAAMRRPEFGQPTSFYGKFMVGARHYHDEQQYLIDNPIHLIDLARFFMGEVDTVHAARAAWPDGRWTYAVTLRFTSGALGTLQFGTTQSWQQHNEFVEITGEGHSVTVDNVTRFRYRPEAGPQEFWEPNFTVPVERNDSLVLAGYAGQFIHFAEVVMHGIAPLASITQARRSLELLAEIRRQAGRGRAQ